jgi:glycine hydroxymethyltransferase
MRRNFAMNLNQLRTAPLDEVDPFVADLLRWEEEQQTRKLILIPSVSSAPRAVLAALGSAYQNVCAEGLPAARMTGGSAADLADVERQLAANRRYADRRFYKGVHYTDLAESLAQRRCAEAFATPEVPAAHLHVNVQALSGGIANLAVYQALMQPGDTLMGMNLYEGGHLSHGSRFNQSGQWYKVVSYAVDRKTERLDYGRIRELAKEHRPRVIIAGYTSYPWAPDWQAFREIADEVGAFFVADIAHTAGLVLAGVIPSPIGLADVVTLTTNKTLCGPRSAAVLTTDKHLAAKIDAAVFPGAQGAPHPNKFVAVAVAFEIARTPAFRRLQFQTAANARALAAGLQARGTRIAYGGTDTHLFVIDLKSIASGAGYPLYGEPAARILELADIVVNKNSIPGDQQTAHATGLRLGTPWLTQRGLAEADMDDLAAIIHHLLASIRPFAYMGAAGILPRGKAPLEAIEQARAGVAALVARTNDPAPPAPAAPANAFRITGARARPFLQQLTTANLARLQPGESQPAYMLDRHGRALDCVTVQRDADAYRVTATLANADRVFRWLSGVSDGYVLFDDQDVLRKVEGPVVVEPAGNSETSAGEVSGKPALQLFEENPALFDLSKPYFVGQSHLAGCAPAGKPRWNPPGEASTGLKRTPLFDLHLASGARLVPFAGWEMPLRYASVQDEHRAVREAAGLFDVAHMGLFEISGENAAPFLDTVFSNYAAWLDDMQACYGYLLDPAGAVIDDAILYRLHAARYLMVVNAANEDKAWHWLDGVNRGEVMLDTARPWVTVDAPAGLRNLKSPEAGRDQLRDIALQGPASLPTLLALAGEPRAKSQLRQLPKNSLMQARLGGMAVTLARTGYTGEEWGFEIFAHPADLLALWQAILAAGAPFGVQPAGLGARDSLRTEAGLPLWGHELAGEFGVSPLEAGFPAFVKFHKPFFVGRDALLSAEKSRAREIVRFRVTAERARMPQTGNPVLDAAGGQAGVVTSCSIDAARRLVGQALVGRAYTAPGTTLSVSAGRGAAVGITVLPRFPRPDANGGAHG